MFAIRNASSRPHNPASSSSEIRRMRPAGTTSVAGGNFWSRPLGIRPLTRIWYVLVRYVLVSWVHPRRRRYADQARARAVSRASPEKGDCFRRRRADQGAKPEALRSRLLPAKEPHRPRAVPHGFGLGPSRLAMSFDISTSYS